MAINDSQMQIIANSLISRQPGAIGVQYLDLSYNRIHYEGIKALVENMTRISKSDDISGANSLHKLLLAGNPIDCRACGLDIRKNSARQSGIVQLLEEIEKVNRKLDFFHFWPPVESHSLAMIIEQSKWYDLDVFDCVIYFVGNKALIAQKQQ
ncbi:MAG: hypothetical protein MHMPM18_003764 [Marteilia pararefringens]